MVISHGKNGSKRFLVFDLTMELGEEPEMYGRILGKHCHRYFCLLSSLVHAIIIDPMIYNHAFRNVSSRRISSRRSEREFQWGPPENPRP